MIVVLISSLSGFYSSNIGSCFLFLLFTSGSAEGGRNNFKASVKSCSSSGGHMRLTSKVSESLDSHIEIPNLTVLKLVFTP